MPKVFKATPWYAKLPMYVCFECWLAPMKFKQAFFSQVPSSVIAWRKVNLAKRVKLKSWWLFYGRRSLKAASAQLWMIYSLTWAYYYIILYYTYSYTDHYTIGEFDSEDNISISQTLVCFRQGFLQLTLRESLQLSTLFWEGNFFRAKCF